MTSWDPFSFTVLYAKLIEGRFKRVVLGDVNFLKSDWYFDHAKKWNPRFTELSEGTEVGVVDAVQEYHVNRNGRKVHENFDRLKRTLVHNSLKAGDRVFYLGLENFQTAPSISPQINKVPAGILTEYIHKTELAGYQPNSPANLRIQSLLLNLEHNDRLHRMLAGFYGLRALETAEWFASKDKKLSQDWLSFSERAAERDPLLREEIQTTKKQLRL
jgi:hypothetical protein